MTRIRIIIPAATIEQTKLYLIRGAALLLCVLIFPIAAYSQNSGSPFDSGLTSIQMLFLRRFREVTQVCFPKVTHLSGNQACN
jgi:hypothetical protein